ncbi:P2R1A-PPP2R2A-interacting phosphatase regulator 1 isoform X2 [Battus philenor]|uniref:P2R1A-PPP2R2A-interacting phosphatase regulator 1 isoform X2 n=1 Tax=Battus philenor TaxID=42288 RepID=UPI0035CF08E5
MDVDAPNILKRCSSAPLINEAPSTAVTSPTTNTAPSTSFFSMFSNSNLSRTRRHSGSSSPLSAPINLSSVWGRRMTPRVSQLRAEECADVSNTREVAHEREVHCAMQMGQSCEDLTLVAGMAHSPTRLARFSPVVSPSPTRKYTTRRSLSPIAIRAATLSPVSRPTVLAGKRRCDDAETPHSKRMCAGRLTPSTPGTPDSDSLECTFRPVSPRAQPMLESLEPENHKSPNPS